MTIPDPQLRSLDDELRALRNVEHQAEQVQAALDRTAAVLAPGHATTGEEAFVAACHLSAARSHLQAGLTYLSAAYTAARHQIPEGLPAVLVVNHKYTEETHP